MTDSNSINPCPAAADPRNYGYGKLGELVSATKLFDIEERQRGNTNSKAIYLRDKRKK